MRLTLKEPSPASFNVGSVELTPDEMPDRADYIEGPQGEDCYVGEIEYRKYLKRIGERLPTNAEQRAQFERTFKINDQVICKACGAVEDEDCKLVFCEFSDY